MSVDLILNCNGVGIMVAMSCILAGYWEVLRFLNYVYLVIDRSKNEVLYWVGSRLWRY